MAAVILGGSLWDWINIGVNALITLNMEQAEDRALAKQWADMTKVILARGPDAKPTADEWTTVLAFAAFEHARAMASPV